MQRIQNLEIEEKRYFEEDGNVIHSRVILGWIELKKLRDGCLLFEQDVSHFNI